MVTAFARCLIAMLCVTFAVGCRESYRVGEFVLVQWCDGEYPAYVTAKKGRTRYRVHFDGYEPRWDTEVGFDEIKGRLETAPKVTPPMCERVAQAMGIQKPEDNKAGLFKVGARVRVTWRGSVYKAVVLEVPAPDRYLVHYDGYETSWDEVVTAERIVGTVK
jgi:RNA binding activity-knot of a chromodomain